MTHPIICPTTRLEKLLLPTNGSEFSEGAIREAINISKACSSKLYAMSVVETNPEYEALAPNLVEKAELAIKEHLDSVRSRASKEGVDCETIVRRAEDPYQPIVEEASQRGVGMIVMGRRGRKGLKRLMMGSQTAKVIGHAACNVLVVPREATTEFKRILTATDGSKYSEKAAAEAIGIAKRSGALLIAVSVVTSEMISPFDIVHSEMQKDLIAGKELKAAEENIKNIKEAAEKEGIRIEGIILAGKPYEAILETAKEKLVDLIVVGSHGRTGIEKLIMGSVTERVIVLSPCPVLVVKV
jgi:nucleotide-binding universal stress UspA family protein